jgi:hypothetical protein
MRVLVPFSGGLVAGALLAFGSLACAPSTYFPSELFTYSLAALAAGLMALPVYASAWIFSRCCAAKVEPVPIAWRAACSFGMAIPIFGAAALGALEATCNADRPPFGYFELPWSGVAYGSDSQQEVWRIALGLLFLALLAGIAPTFLADPPVVPAASPRRGVAKWTRLLLAATGVSIVVVTAASGGFWLAQAIGGSNETAESVAIIAVWGTLGIIATVVVFAMGWPPARWVISRSRVIKSGWIVVPALLLVLVATEAPPYIQAWLLERDCARLAHWLCAHQAPGSYSALALPGKFARLSDAGSADAIVRPDGGVVLVLKIQWFELIYSSSSNAPPEIKTDSFGRRYLPISGQPAYLIDTQLNGNFYTGEAWHIPLVERG